jgi:predicted nucleic acid-binding protein
MKLTVDTSVVIAVIANEEHKQRLLALSEGADLIAPSSLHWEVGNALSSMLKRNMVSLQQAEIALAAYREVPIQFHEVDLGNALRLCSEFNLYAYDAYIIECALRFRSPLPTLDGGLPTAAREAGVSILEVER